MAPQAIDVMQQDLALDDFAAALSATDLVISVDTMAAHCAGALGHPVWVAIPAAPAWYWGLRDHASIWYPSSRLFRQTIRNDWCSVVTEMAARLSDDGTAKFSSTAPAVRPAQAG